MKPLFAAAAAISLFAMPQMSPAATFYFSTIERYDHNWDELFEFGGQFEATDQNGDGYITTEEVELFQAKASVYSSHFGYEALGRSGSRSDRFEVRHQIGAGLVENLMIASNDGDIECASDAGNPSEFDRTLSGDVSFQTGASGSAFDVATTYRYDGDTRLCDSYREGGFYEEYDFRVGIRQVGDATPLDVPAPVPLPATALLLLGALGLSGAGLRWARN